MNDNEKEQFNYQMIGMLVAEISRRRILRYDMHRDLLETFASPKWKTYEKTGRLTITIELEDRNDPVK